MRRGRRRLFRLVCGSCFVIVGGVICAYIAVSDGLTDEVFLRVTGIFNIDRMIQVNGRTAIQSSEMSTLGTLFRWQPPPTVVSLIFTTISKDN